MKTGENREKGSTKKSGGQEECTVIPIPMHQISLEDEKPELETTFLLERCSWHVWMEETEGRLHDQSWDSNLEVYGT